tara:strand:- start:5170 stop:5427 length:258 start_codon:yes stop_codon:yes gene_type:complete
MMNMENKESEVFQTSNTPLAAYLVTEGYAIIDVVFNGSKAFFLFANDSDKLQQQVKDFELLRAPTNAAQIVFNYQELVKRTKRGY